MTCRDGKKVKYPNLDFIILGFVVVFLFWVPWFYGLTRFRDQLLAELIIFGLFLFSFPLLQIQRFQIINLRKIDGWVILAPALILINNLWISVLPRSSFFVFTHFLSLAAFYFVIRALIVSNKALQIVLYSIFAAGLAYSVYGLLQYYGQIPHPFWYTPQSMASRYVNGGHFAAFLLFSLFIGMSIAISARNRLIQLALLIPFSIISWAFVLTRSRTVWLAFFVGLLFFAYFLYRYGFVRNVKISWVAALIGAPALFFILYKSWGVVAARFEEIWKSKDAPFYSLIYRLELWEGCLKAIWSRPWGWGAGTFSAVFPLYRVNDDRFFVDYAHNEILHTGVDFGLPGIIFIAAIFVLYIKKAAGHLKNRAIDFNDRMLGAALVAVWISFFISSQSDFPIRIFATSIFAAVFLALSARLFDSGNGDDILTQNRLSLADRRIHLSGLIVCAFVLVISMLTAGQLLGEVNYKQGAALEKDYQWDKAISSYNKAIAFSLRDEEYYRALADIYRKKMGLSFGSDLKKKWRKLSITAYDRAIKLNPFVATNYYYRGLLYEEDSDLGNAELQFKKSIQHDPTNSFFVLEYGYFALRHGRVKDAIDAFEKYKHFKFREGVSLCDIMKKVSDFTINYDDLKRVVLDDWEGHRCLGLFLADAGDWGHAKMELDLCLKEAKSVFDYSAFWRNFAAPIAELYISHGNREDALSLYRESVRLNPSDKEARRRLEELSRTGTEKAGS